MLFDKVCTGNVILFLKLIVLSLIGQYACPISRVWKLAVDEN